MNFLSMIKEINNKVSKDNITGYAAQSCFYLVLSFFPFIMLMLTLVKFLPIDASVIITFFNNIIPPKLDELMNGIISDVYTSSSLTLTSITAITALWASGKGVVSLMRGFNDIYDIKENRNFIIQRLIATFYTFVFIIVILLSLVLLVFGNQLLIFTSNYIPAITSIIDAILSHKLLLFPCILILFFMFMYKFIPNRKTSLLNEIPGAILATIGWYVFSYAYSLYVNNSPNFSYMYGSLATVIFALVWIYFCMLIIYFGAEFNMLIKMKIITKDIFKKK